MSETKKKISIKEYSEAIMEFLSNSFKNLPKTINDGLSNERIRYGVVIVIIFLNIYNYKHNKQKHSKKKIFNINISTLYFILGGLLLIIDAIFLFFLQKEIQILSLPNFWWTIVIFVGFMALSAIKDSSKLVEKDGTLNPPPIGIKRHGKRIKWCVITLLVSLLSIYIENINKKDNKLLILRTISTILIIIYLYYTYNFTACDYNLPETWRL